MPKPLTVLRRRLKSKSTQIELSRQNYNQKLEVTALQIQSLPKKYSIFPKALWDDNLGILRRIRELIIVLAAIATAAGAWLTYRALVETGKSVENSIATAIYVGNNTPTQLLVEHPDLIEYFDKSARDPTISDELLINQFDKLLPEKRNLIMAICMVHADYAELTFIQRKVIPACDWNGWWRYYTDLYDESPIFRRYLSNRSTWYLIDNAITIQRRDKYFKTSMDDCTEMQ